MITILYSSIQESARQAAASATQLITSAHNAAHYNSNKYSQDTLASECGVLEQQSARLARAARSWAAAPGQPAANLDLLAAADAFLQVGIQYAWTETRSKHALYSSC